MYVCALVINLVLCVCIVLQVNVDVIDLMGKVFLPFVFGFDLRCV